MRGKPLRLCAQGHEALWTEAEACPFCAALAEVVRLKKELAAVRKEQGKGKEGKP